MTTTQSTCVRRIGKKCCEAVGQSFLQLTICLILAAGAAQAQSTRELFANSYAGPPPNGPLLTQTVQLLADPAPGTTPPTIVSVTATISSQQYVGVGTGPGDPVVMFGGRRADGTTTINTTPIFDEMNTIASPANTMFSSVNSGAATGISVADNFAFSVYSSIQHWEGLSVPATNSRIYLADLTLTFDSPVNNPHLHLVGMGGFVGVLGYATELDLTTPGLTLTKLQGNPPLVVSGNQINNSIVTGILTECSNDTAGCGTVRVNGTGITTLSFQVFIRGDGGTATWSGPDRNEGDFWMIGVSLPFGTTAADVTVAGRAVTANGRGISGARITLVAGSGQVRTATTNPFGYYRFDGLDAGDTAVVSIASKRHRFQESVWVVDLGDSAFDVNFVAE